MASARQTTALIPGLIEEPYDPHGKIAQEKHVVDSWVESDRGYLDRAAYENRVLDDIGTIGPYTPVEPRILAWERLVATLKDAPLDDLTKAQVVNAWCNEVMHYDVSKTLSKPTLYDQTTGWTQTALETLNYGTGQCSDIATLKYETLKRVGVKLENMRVVNARIHDDQDWSVYDSHQFLAVKFKDQWFALGDRLTDQGSRLHYGDLHAMEGYLGGNLKTNLLGTIEPVTSFSGNRFFQYPNAPEFIRKLTASIRESPKKLGSITQKAWQGREEFQFGADKDVWLAVDKKQVNAETLNTLQELVLQIAKAHDLNVYREEPKRIKYMDSLIKQWPPLKP